MESAHGDELEIRNLGNAFAEAVRSRDTEAILSFYSPDAVIYDVNDSLQYDREGIRKIWDSCFANTRRFEVKPHDVTVRVEGSLAYTFGLSHATGENLQGGKIDLWVRATECYRKEQGRWLVVHDHVSVPGNFATGELLTDLKP
jgi:uncharacterized protein (TIGR02246 family)